MGLHTHVLEYDGGVIPLSGSSGPGHVHVGVHDVFGGEFTTTPADDDYEHRHYVRLEDRNVLTGTPIDVDAGSEIPFTNPGSGSAEKRGIAKMEYPRVLTMTAVREGWLPESGSGLPPTLESVVPGELEYWKASDRDTALVIRRYLVESQILAEDRIRAVALKRGEEMTEPVPMLVVDGEIQWEADKSSSPVKPAFKSDVQIASELASLQPDARIIDVGVLKALIEIGKAEFVNVIGECVRSGKEWLLEVDAGSSAEEELLKRYDACTVFRLQHSDAKSYISSSIPDPSSGARYLIQPSELVKGGLDLSRNMSPAEVMERIDSLALTRYQREMAETFAEMVKKAGSTDWSETELRAAHRIRVVLDSELAKSADDRRVDLLKSLGVDTERAGHNVLAKADTVKIRKFATGHVPTERLVFGIVLEPDVGDLQGDVLSKETIKRAFYDFVENHRHIGLQHQEILDGDCRITQAFLAPCDFKDNAGNLIREGSWVMEYRIVKDGLWKAILAGEFTGFSIGGNGRRVPIKN